MVKQAATRTANLARTDRRAQAALEARQGELVERIVILLGSMRGAATKVGQMLSMADAGLVPVERRVQFRERLATLRDQAPPVSWDAMRGHIARELGADPREVFSEFETRPVAAASIGQVYRARMHDGRDVAVKVQYPGIDEAIDADMKMLSVALKVLPHVHPGVEASDIAAEIEHRCRAELDYVAEAGSTQRLADAYRDHPFIRVPDVVHAVGSPRVLVTEWIDGRPLLAARDEPDEARARIAEILFRFYVGGPFTAGITSLDPHPGNALLRDDGSVAFVDFGSTEQPGRDEADRRLAVMRALFEEAPGRLTVALGERGVVAQRDVDDQHVFDAFRSVFGWYAADEEVVIPSTLADDMIAGGADPRTVSADVFRSHEVPAGLAWLARAEVAVASTIGQIEPRINLHRVAREWLYGDEPVTELGRRHQTWRREAERG